MKRYSWVADALRHGHDVKYLLSENLYSVHNSLITKYSILFLNLLSKCLRKLSQLLRSVSIVRLRTKATEFVLFVSQLLTWVT
jgi:hypothetical protein